MTSPRRGMFRYRRSRTVQGCALGFGFVLIFAWKFYYGPHAFQSTQNQEISPRNSLSKDDNVMDFFSDPFLLWESKVPTRQLMTTLQNCTPPAVNQFPSDLFTQEQRKNGAIVIHVLSAIYIFLGLSIICDSYFVPSLEAISEALNLQTDVAGATFMAAGSSAPELATSIIGVFVAKNDIGLGTVVGSAVYNILFVTSICALFAGAAVHLNWWPMFRDCTCYTLSIIALLVIILDEIVKWYEALTLVLLYLTYIFLMYLNPRLEKWAVSHCTCLTSSSPPIANKMSDEVNVYNKLPSKGISEEDLTKKANEPTETSPNNNSNHEKPPPLHPTPHTATTPFDTDSDSDEFDEKSIFLSWDKGFVEEPANNTCWTTNMPPVEVTAPEEKSESVFSIPSTVLGRIHWVVSLPIVFVLFLTIPDCRKPRFQRCYLITFFISVIWLSIFSFLMVWMITVTGYTLGIPDTVMGLTFVAFGVSVPDAIASLIVVREGYGDMAISNAVGSNVFDILLCMGLPWLLSTVVYQKDVVVYSEGLTYSVITLLSTVVFLLLATHFNGWKLSIRYGICLMVVYVFFTVLSVSYELNFFGYLHPPSCDVVY